MRRSAPSPTTCARSSAWAWSSSSARRACAARSNTTIAPCGRPTVTDEAWAAAPAIAKQAAVSASLQTIDAYARAASAAGGFDHGNSHLTRTQLTLDARGWSDLSRACMRLLDQVDRIGEAASERIERNPHSGDTKDVALVMMLFEAARLAVEAEGDPVVERRRRHRRPVTPELAE